MHRSLHIRSKPLRGGYLVLIATHAATLCVAGHSTHSRKRLRTASS